MDTLKPNSADQRFNDTDATVQGEEQSEAREIRWSNLIFLPFHPVFKIIMFCTVICKALMGPIQAVFPIYTLCSFNRTNLLYLVVRNFYDYCCGPLYAIDMLLHILHRQIASERMHREYLPKSKTFLLFDLIAIIPWFSLLISGCPEPKLWPNIMSFTDFIVVYRLVDYFSLFTSHSKLKLIAGVVTLLVVTVNCISCLLLLLTLHGMCGRCRDYLYDWRMYVEYKLPPKKISYELYVYSTTFVLSIMNNQMIDVIQPTAIAEYVLSVILMMFGNVTFTFFFMPKIFAEGVLRLRRPCGFFSLARRVIEETKLRNPNPVAQNRVQRFYSLMWNYRSGISCIPPIISVLPRYMRTEIRLDLVWPVFYHSPTLRNTSQPFKRWLCEYIRIDFKLPGEAFFSGPHANTNLFYIKTGIVQIISLDDGTTAMLSVTSGTVFGDISFFVPPFGRLWKVQCLTYCEVFHISRADILRSLIRFPADRRQLMTACANRMKHARTLFNYKLGVRGLDRSEDEGIQWLKRRWWEISAAVTEWQKNNDPAPIKFPPEELSYHCAKYIGQVVLCSEEHLHSKSLFTSDKFPWILYPTSIFSKIWYWIVLLTVYQVLIVYPVIITRVKVPAWFRYFQHWTDFVYIADICVSLSTAITTAFSGTTSSFSDIMFYRFKSLRFNMDLLATIWFEEIAVFVGRPDLYYVCLYNRLIKVYTLFTATFAFKKVTFSNPIASIIYKLTLIQICYSYIVGCLFFLIARKVKSLTRSFWLGDLKCIKPDSGDCDPTWMDAILVAFLWMFEMLLSEWPPQFLTDIYFSMPLSVFTCLLLLFCRTTFIAALYQKMMDACDFQIFVTNIRSHYKIYKIHPHLMNRLNKYLTCHWKYYDGMDVMKPNLLRYEPHDVFWHAHGEVAMNIIGGSMAFQYANSSLVRDLAYKSKFIIIPKGTTVLLYGVNCKRINWLSRGSIKTEYIDSDGVTQHTFVEQGEILAFASVFMGRSSIRTYTTSTDVELLYVTRKYFFKTLQDYPNEWSYLSNCIANILPEFNKVYDKYVKEHKDYRKILRDRVFHATASLAIKSVKATPKNMKTSIKSNPESRLKFWWSTFRAFVVFVSIICTTLVGSTGPMIYAFTFVINCCEIIGFIDIVLKIFLNPYYGDNGIIIYSTKKCILHYLTHGFILDLIGSLPVPEILTVLPYEHLNISNMMLLNTWCKFSHLYLLVGYIDYLADRPSSTSIYLKILKMQIVLLLCMLAASQYFVFKCIHFTWNYTHDGLVLAPIKNSWLPKHVVLDNPPTSDQLRMVLAQSLSLAQCGLARINLGLFNVKREHVGICVVLLLLGALFWITVCYTVALLCLCRRSNTLFRHGVSQLKRFLEAERVNKKLIERVLNHFRYQWVRTRGVNIENLMEERMGVVFRQDLSFFFYKSSLLLSDTLLRGGDAFLRRLSSTLGVIYYEKGDEIMREMDLAPWIFIVHRGTATITQGGEQLAVLTKGALFGQLTGTTPRPVLVSATATDYCDILRVPIKTFYDLIEDKVLANICNHPNSANDFMNLFVEVPEDPYNTVLYIIRDKKTVKMPFMKEPMEAVSGTGYANWLILSYVVAPVITAALTLHTFNMPSSVRLTTFHVLGVFDVIEGLQLVSDFYNVRLIVYNGECGYRLRKFTIVRSKSFWISVASLVIPYAVLFDYRNWWLLLAKLLRLKHLLDFHKQFCNSFKSKATPLVMNFIYICLAMHAIICCWMAFACQEFPIKEPELHDEVNKTINYEEWTLPSIRGYGCARLTKFYRIKDASGKQTDTYAYSFVVPTHWIHDYTVATTFIMIIFTNTDLDCILPVTYQQVFLKVIIAYLVRLIVIWVICLAISCMYMKLGELYHYDYNILKLTTYLMHTGLSPVVLESVRKYVKQLWQRQSGNWMPEMAIHTPVCLKEDILAALYMHHLEAPALFRALPPYFTRQLVTRLHRVVIFPGKSIMKEGDVFPCVYFIHEGDVEKWHTDASGEVKLLSHLTTCGYFGLTPLLFPTSPHPFTYVARTVVDLVFFRHHDWYDLLEAYPEDKENLYAAAAIQKHDYADM